MRVVICRLLTGGLYDKRPAGFRSGEIASHAVESGLRLVVDQDPTWRPHLVSSRRWTGKWISNQVGEAPFDVKLCGPGDLLVFVARAPAAPAMVESDMLCGFLEVEELIPLGRQVKAPPWMDAYRVEIHDTALDWDDPISVVLCGGKHATWNADAPSGGLFLEPHDALALTRPGARAPGEWSLPEPFRAAPLVGEYGAEVSGWTAAGFVAGERYSDFFFGPSRDARAWAERWIDSNLARQAGTAH